MTIIFTYGVYHLPAIQRPTVDKVFDVRSVLNPYRLRPSREQMIRLVLADEKARKYIEDIFWWCLESEPAREQCDLQIAVTCAWGQHRSCIIAEAVATRLREEGIDVQVCHLSKMFRESPRF